MRTDTPLACGRFKRTGPVKWTVPGDSQVVGESRVPAERGHSSLPRPICPRCGAEVPAGWPARGHDRCVECGTPLGRRALTSAIIEVGQKVGRLLTLGTGLIAAGMMFLIGSITFESSLSAALRSPTIPAWAIEEVSVAFALFVAGGVLSAWGGWMSRRELRRRGIDSPTARSAAQAFFPRYAVSRLIRAGRLEVVEPVLPHPTSGWPMPYSAHPAWSPVLRARDRSTPRGRSD
jgi:hypothetical protein